MKRRRRKVGLWIIPLLCLNLVACFRSLNVSKIKCNSRESCPSGHTCVDLADAGYGQCLPGLPDGATVGSGGGAGGAFGTGDEGDGPASDARGSTGGTGPRDLDGGVNQDGRITTGGSSGGNIGGSTGGRTGTGTGTSPRGGSGGNPNPDAPGATGGMGGTSSSIQTATAGNGGGGTTATPIDAPVLPPDTAVIQPLGGPCQDRSQCASGFCADGVCCDGACQGQCESCSSAGKCTPAPKGPAPASRTPCTGKGVCVGQCNGTSGAACVFPDENVICTAASCKLGLATTASVCNKLGNCTDSSTDPCSSGQCATDGSGKCANSCTPIPDSCGSDKYCNTSGGVCVAKKSPGAACTAKEECAVGFCVDGVCCDSECKDQCTACNLAGVCARISGVPKNGRPACTSTDTLCEGKCDLSSNTCSYPGSSISCEAAKCSPDQNSVITARTCNLQGACTTSKTDPCGAAAYCSSGACIARSGDGSSCSASVQCTSGFCTSTNICCPTGNIACFGVCMDGQSDPANCGGCGVKCASNQTCSGGSCRCSGSSLQCGSTTVCSSTGFEAGSLDGWSLDSSTYANAASNIRTVTGVAHGGSMMLNAVLGYNSTDYKYADFLVTLCDSASVATVTSFSIWVSVTTTSSTPFTLQSTFTFSGGTGVKTVSPSTSVSSDGNWYNLTGSVSGQASKVQVRFTSASNPTSAKVYIDDADFR